MPANTPLHPGAYYHIYNRGNNRETLFQEERNYLYFLNLYKRYLLPVIDTYCYCLLRNHFHFLIRVKDRDELANSHATEHYASKAFAYLFGTYTKAYNKAYQRTGSLFEKPFERKGITEDNYLIQLVLYIHLNPCRHGLVSNFQRWPHSSYNTLVAHGTTHLRRDDVLSWFGGRANFIEGHEQILDESSIQGMIFEDD